MRILTCVECEVEIGPARASGSGRQVELCRDCYDKSRKESHKRWGKIRSDENRSVKEFRK